MANPIFISQQLNQQNYPNQIAKGLESIFKNRLRHRYGVMVDEDADEFHRNLLVLIHSDSEKTRERALWW